VKYTEHELELAREAKIAPQRIVSATWINGKGPRGGKVSIGKGRYDTLNLMVIEGKAEVIGRFQTPPFYAGLTMVGIIARINTVRIK
jgi:hypothetical protein